MTAGYFGDTVEAVADHDLDDLDEVDFEAPDIVPRTGEGASVAMQAYFADLERDMRRCLEVATRCRERGLDPEEHVEIPAAEDLAARVEELVSDYLPQRGVAVRIRELSSEMNRELMSLVIAKEVAAAKFGTFPNQDAAIDAAVRTGLAILTEGILVAPLDGIAGVRVLHNDDGSSCLGVKFAGPIRAAGGTGQALSVLIADVVRRELGIGRYRPTTPEVDRFKEEIPAYKQAANLQYTPTSDEIELIVRNCPIMVDGEPTEDQEVGGNRNLPRIETNRLRGGACLVIAEGLTLKAPKIQKHVKNLALEGWEFIDRFVNKGKSDAEAGASAEGSGGDAALKPSRPRIDANPKYMAELVAGRPVFAHPSRKGGWRLRYGRARTGGLATLAVTPAAMFLVDDFLAVGTQMKIERPGKATVATPCDEIEGPIALLRNGSLVEVRDGAHAKEIRPTLVEIVDLGEMLVPYGEFAENNKTLPQAAYAPEWWEQDVERATGAEAPEIGTGREATAFAMRTNTPLHPFFNLFWHDLSRDELATLSDAVLSLGEFATTEGVDSLVMPKPREAGGPARVAKDLLVNLGCLHEADDTHYIITRYAYPLVRGLGLEVMNGVLARVRAANDVGADVEDVCEVASALAGFKIMPRAPCYIGTRMGRPEKAAERKMTPPVHVLFPLSNQGGTQRLIRDAAAKGVVEIEIGMRRCRACGEKSVVYKCPTEGCEGRTEPMPQLEGRPEPERVDVGALLERAQRSLGNPRLPETIKGVQKLLSRHKSAEILEKGILRAKHNVFTFKDGTARFDMTDVTLTHFKPREINVEVRRLRELGYELDHNGEPLTRDDQVCELKVQDVVVSTSCVDYLLKVMAFMDDLLTQVYGIKPFYNCQTREDVIGHLLIALAPHTSGGVLCRLIGHTRAQVGFGHPYFHAAKRRNCDGDEDAIMLLLEGLVNFSRSYLPQSRGGLMDAPLTLTLRLDPNEVDKEAHNVDCMRRYPIEFFEATMKHPQPGDVAKLMDMVSTRLGKPGQYEGIGFTHDTADIAEGPAASAYKTIGSMMDKMEAQLELGRKLRAVDAADVAARVIGSHFLPDLMGNLKAFSKQSLRCTKCGSKYRRIPIQGKCLKKGCSNTLTMTVHEASVKKYLEVSKQICEKYNVNMYVRQRIEHIEDSIDSLFLNDKVKKAKLSDFF